MPLFTTRERQNRVQIKLSGMNQAGNKVARWKLKNIVSLHFFIGYCVLTHRITELLCTQQYSTRRIIFQYFPQLLKGTPCILIFLNTVH